MKRLILTAGEPAGIGPDIILQLVQEHSSSAQWVVVADKQLLAERAQQLGRSIELLDWHPQVPITPQRLNQLWVHHVPLAQHCIAGQLNVANATYVLETLQFATQACLNQQFDALVTAPVHKGIINDAQIPFTGHTEFLAELTHTQRVVMMLAADELRVALVTTHLPLVKVPSAITGELIIETVHIVQRALQQQFHIKHPRLLVCGLNPHAGEQGHLGGEELAVISPALHTLQQAGIAVTGPLPADTIFAAHHLANADVVIAMYHDQGLPVVKYHSFGHAVNVTLGLPIIRTSVDHGTALDLAGSGNADPGSLLAAVNLAVKMAGD
ncbi:MAG: 4-hydroxythreonine-4-phosphate dehydrogenase PdxA [Legionellales bacterium]|nr:4-hydroxythreonine-4-phosphate dehydrogenase PdxA [Legionellales bacterium]